MKYPHSKALVECTGIWTFEAIWGVFNITLGEWDYKTASKAMIMVTQNSISYTWLIYEIRIYGCWTMVDAIHTQESYRVRCIMMQWWWNTCLNGGVFFCFFFVMFFFGAAFGFWLLASWLLGFWLLRFLAPMAPMAPMTPMAPTAPMWVYMHAFVRHVDTFFQQVS